MIRIVMPEKQRGVYPLVVLLGSIVSIATMLGLVFAYQEFTSDSDRPTLDSTIAKFDHEFEGVPHLKPTELKFFVREKRDIVLIDAREPAERNVSTLPDAITIEEFERQPNRLKDRQVIVYCTVGYRSGIETKRLISEGINALNLRGGIIGWCKQNGKLVDPDGNSTRKVHTYGQEWDFVPERYEAVW